MKAAIARVAMLFTDLDEAGVKLRMVNLGGGYPVRYRAEVPEIDAFADAIMGAMAQHFGNALPEIVVEPGRFIVGDAGVVSARSCWSRARRRMIRCAGSISTSAASAAWPRPRARRSSTPSARRMTAAPRGR